MPDTAHLKALARNAHEAEDIPSNESAAPKIGEVIAARFSRRDALRGGAAMLALGAAAAAGLPMREAKAGMARGLTFMELEHGYDENFHTAPGYDSQVLIRWGDPVEAGAPAFDPRKQSAAAQAKQFGYNNDFIGYLPLPAGSANPERGILCINHEYTDAHLMFPGITEDNRMEATTPELVDIELAAHGMSIVEVARAGGAWRVVGDSPYNRRITASATRMRVSGPAAGHARLKTKADPSGELVIGTLNNCAGGVTPWGTVLTAEENFNGYFGGDPEKTSEARNFKRYGVTAKSWYPWYKHVDRFNVEMEPHEPNRFGWMVEIDPYDPLSVPVKRTALGRFKHEGASVAVNKDGRVVLYSGDDERFDYVYKFVSDGRYDPNDRAANRDLLDSGTLFVARFNADGTLDWMPLVWGAGPLTPDNGFASQADVLIEARRAADLLGATPMDRPEDIEVNPVTGGVFLMLTNNTKRKADQVDAVNPRANNEHGHILELIPPGGRGAEADHTALNFNWEIPVLAGDPAKPEDGAKYHAKTSANGWLSCPDNCAFDSAGNLWIATDGAPKAGLADGVWAMPVEGEDRARTKHFLRTPRGAELCGPCFTPDDGALFVAVQHPADEKGSTFDSPSTGWPDFTQGMPARPSVVVVTKQGGGPVGS